MRKNSCCGPEHLLSRRELLFGSAKAAAFLAAVRCADADVNGQAVKTRGTAKTCIYITLNGAPSHVDTWDPKDGPWNPSDVDLRQYSGGMVLSHRLYPTLSQLTGDLLFLRSVTSWELAHDRGQFYTQTAHASNPAFVAESPNVGAVVSYELGKHGPLPPFLALNVDAAFQGAKFLGGFNEPLIAPVQPTGLTTLQHNYYGNNSQQIFNQKYAMLRDLDAPLIASPYSDEMAAHATFYDSAKGLMYDPAVASVFQFTSDESSRYGDTAFGRACIVARNAVTAKLGISFINIVFDGWDTHVGMFDPQSTTSMYALANQLDIGVGMLMKDLKATGDLGNTLIVLLGEFGRTPGLLNSQGGRDHWKDAMSICLAGGGIKGGRAIGQTTALGDEITDPQWSGNRGIFMEDIACTIYSALGIDWTKTISNTPSGRVFEYVPQAHTGVFTSVDEVFGYMRRGLLLVFLFAACLHAQRAAAAFVNSPTSQVVAGDSAALTVTAYDATGAAIPAATFAWSVSDSSAFSVDNKGVVTAKSLGWSDIYADTTGARGTIRLQATPLAIVVHPANQTINAGDSLQFSADVLDKNSTPLSGVNIQWRAYGAISNPSSTISATTGGLVTATAAGPYFIEAFYNYTVGSGPFLPRVFGNTLLTVVSPTPYQANKLFDSGAVRQSFQLRERRGQISVNDAGEVAYVGWMEGFATAGLLWKNGSLNALIAASNPGQLPGTNLLDLDDMAINNNGEVSGRCYLNPYTGCLLFGPATGPPDMMLFDGSAGQGITNIRNFLTTRFGLNDSSVTLFRADYQDSGSSVLTTGLFTATPDGEATLMVPAATLLPGLGSTYTFDRDFGIANDGTLLFYATNGSSRALYRMTPDYTITRVIGTDDMVAGSPVTSLGNVAVGKSGQYATYINNGTTTVLLYAGDPAKHLELPVSYVNQVLAVGASGDIVFTGGAFNSTGVFRWDGKTAKTVALVGAPSPTGDSYTQFDSAGITAAGNVIIQARTVENILMVVSVGNVPRVHPSVLFQAGTPVNVSAGPSFSNFVLNSHTGSPMIKTGNYSVDVIEYSSGSLLPRLVNGDRMPDGWFYEGTGDVRRNGDGDMFVSTDQSLTQVRGSASTLLAHYPQHAAGGTLNSGYQIAADSSGDVAILGGTSFGVNHLSLVQHGSVTPIAYLGTAAAYRTASPGGGFFLSSSDIGMSETGVVFANLHVSNGPDGLFAYSGGTWTTVLKVGDAYDTRSVTAINSIRVAGTACYALIQTSGSLYHLARYQNGAWQDFINYGDVLLGGPIYGIGAFDANRQGGLTAIVYSNGVQYVIYTDGTKRLNVVDNAHPIAPSGDLLANIMQLSINDDGRIFAIAINALDQMALYEFDPI